MTEEEMRQAEELIQSFRRPIDSNSSRKHHYIPQFHLRRFANDDGSLLVVPADKSKPERLSKPENVAVVKDFYTTFEPELGDTVEVEDLLSVIEGSASGAIDRAAYGVLFPPQLKDRQALNMWAALQYIRGPEVRRRMEALTDYVVKLPLTGIETKEQALAYLADGAERPPTDGEVEDFLARCSQLEDLQFVAPQNNHIQLMLEVALEAAVHLACRYIAIVKYDGPGLMLPNRPVTLIQENHDPLRGVGIATADEIGIALDRETALVFHSDPVVGDRVIRESQDKVLEWNQYVAQFPTEEIYCHPDDRHMVPPLLDVNDQPVLEVNGTFGTLEVTDGVNAPPERVQPLRFAATRPEDPSQF